MVVKRSAKPEIMSPAGYWPQLRTAIEAGADAVYFGLKHFTARAKVGFSLEELPEAMRTLHRRGVKGYVTFNTLVFDHEIEEASRTLAAIAEAGADAIIVQDLGAVKLARDIAPGLEIHGSTQMSVTSADGVRFAQSLGVSRVVMARELSLDEIRAIRAETDCELEMFVHGALCVSYSGQCFSSEAWGGRSANRGQCAQACRLPYEMMVDGAIQPLADARYLLSPGDLYALRQIPEIVEIGVSALKIEGRYKDADYVALTTRAYRKAVDDAWAGLTQRCRPRRRAATRTGLFARPRPAFPDRDESSGRGQGPRAAPSRRAHGTRDAHLRRRRRSSNRPPRTISLRSNRAMAWCSTRPIGAAPRSPKKAAASSRCSGRELRFGNGAIDVVAHPPRRSGLAHARSGFGQGGAPLHRGRHSSPQAAGKCARESARRRAAGNRMASGPASALPCSRRTR